MAAPPRARNIRGLAIAGLLVGIVGVVWGGVGSLAPFLVYNGTAVHTADPPVVWLSILAVIVAALLVPVVAIVIAAKVLRNFGTDRVARLLGLITMVLGLTGAIAVVSGSLPVILEIVLTLG